MGRNFGKTAIRLFRVLRGGCGPGAWADHLGNRELPAQDDRGGGAREVLRGRLLHRAEDEGGRIRVVGLGDLLLDRRQSYGKLPTVCSQHHS